jgi:threonine aldolase
LQTSTEPDQIELVLAAAGIVALSGHVERLAEDHENARKLVLGLAEIRGS